MICLALMGIAGVAFTFGESLAVRFGQTAAFQDQAIQPPNVSLGELLAAAH